MELLTGLGDLLNNKQKDWVREKLVEELLFCLDLYQSELDKSKGEISHTAIPNMSLTDVRENAYNPNNWSGDVRI